MTSLDGKRVWVAGHRGMVGSAIVRRLAGEDCQILTVSREDVDLTQPEPTRRWIERRRPEIVFVAAARVGGILANAAYPADFLYDNLMIAANIMSAANQVGVEKLVWLASSCVYPKFAGQPIREGSLLTGPLEKTNEAYAIAKIAGIILARSYARQSGDRFITAMPTNLYGPHDNFDPATAHVLPALMRRIHEAKVGGSKSVALWGSGRPLRGIHQVDDLADACVFLAQHYDDGEEPVNVGSGEEISIRDLAELVARVVGYDGAFIIDASKPDGTPRKRLDTAKMDGFGWRPKISLEAGVRDLYRRWLEASAPHAAAGPTRERRAVGALQDVRPSSRTRAFHD